MELHKTYADHFSQFILHHAEELRDFVSNNCEDYYEDYETMVLLFNLFAEEYLDSDSMKYHGIGLADIIGDEWVIHRAQELYDERVMNEYTISAEISLVEEIKVRAKSKEDALYMFLNDVATYSELIDQFTGSKHYNGLKRTKVINIK